MAHTRCPSCQAERLVIGTVRSSGVTHFRPDYAKFLSFRTAEIKVRALMCSTCGLISMIGDANKLRLLEPRHVAEKELASEST